MNLACPLPSDLLFSWSTPKITQFPWPMNDIEYIFPSTRSWITFLWSLFGSLVWVRQLGKCRKTEVEYQERGRQGSRESRREGEKEEERKKEKSKSPCSLCEKRGFGEKSWVKYFNRKIRLPNYTYILARDIHLPFWLWTRLMAMTSLSFLWNECECIRHCNTRKGIIEASNWRS